jgi:alkanesulfonate monooxygenase SsuD/methylene tetrahydromethanopterin reductase-like flavin-dependent oxidoreductase (luciferase family)
MKVSIVVMNPMFLEGHWDRLDAIGFDSLYVVDHPYMDTPDPWPMLAYVSARTERIKLGTHVTAAPLHHPTELASAVATVDLVSKGRARVGIGAGYNHSDFIPFGFGPRPSMRDRLDRMEEMIQVMKLLWTSDSAEFHGDYFEYKGGALLRPRPVQDPHPPIIIGVNVEGRALDIAMRHADEINTWQLGPDAVGDLAKAVSAGCGRLGRQALRITSDVLLIKDGDEAAAQQLVETIQKGARAGGRGTKATQWDSTGVLYGGASDVAAQARAFASAGVEELVVSIGSLELMDWFAEDVLPEIAG